MPVESNDVVAFSAIQPAADRCRPVQPRKVYGPIALAVVGGLTALALFSPSQPGAGFLAQASAHQPIKGGDIPPDDPTGRVSAAEQRKEMIAVLRQMNSRIERIESMMNRGLTVKVSEMPPIRLPKEDDKK